MRCDVVKKAGFFISKAYPHLRASPDGIVPASELSDESLVEVKCYYANRFSGEPPNYLYKVASHFKLRRDHKYYYQIQGQLHCTGLEMCYLVIYTFPRLFIVRVYKDANFCNRHMIPKLNQFYYQYFKPLIVDKQQHGVGCACKFCLRYKYSGPPYEDPLTFEIESECTCEACMQIHYFKKHLRCEETWMESTEYCICATCQTRRTMGGLFANVTPTSGCICKACREIRNRIK